jgi:hypothetical protein
LAAALVSLAGVVLVARSRSWRIAVATLASVLLGLIVVSVPWSM